MLSLEEQERREALVERQEVMCAPGTPIYLEEKTLEELVGG